MGHQIIIENSTIEDSEITNRVYLSAEDGSIVIRDMKLTKTKLVNDPDIPQFCSSIQNQRMDAAERTSMQSVLKKRGNKKDFVDTLIQHLSSFAEGVAANIVASFIRL